MAQKTSPSDFKKVGDVTNYMDCNLAQFNDKLISGKNRKKLMDKCWDIYQASLVPGPKPHTAPVSSYGSLPAMYIEKKIKENPTIPLITFVNMDAYNKGQELPCSPQPCVSAPTSKKPEKTAAQKRKEAKVAKAEEAARKKAAKEAEKQAKAALKEVTKEEPKERAGGKQGSGKCAMDALKYKTPKQCNSAFKRSMTPAGGEKVIKECLHNLWTCNIQVKGPNKVRRNPHITKFEYKEFSPNLRKAMNEFRKAHSKQKESLMTPAELARAGMKGGQTRASREVERIQRETAAVWDSVPASKRMGKAAETEVDRLIRIIVTHPDEAMYQRLQEYAAHGHEEAAAALKKAGKPIPRPEVAPMTVPRDPALVAEEKRLEKNRKARERRAAKKAEKKAATTAAKVEHNLAIAATLVDDDDDVEVEEVEEVSVGGSCAKMRKEMFDAIDNTIDGLDTEVVEHLEAFQHGDRKSLNCKAITEATLNVRALHALKERLDAITC
tara:strand:- start:1048 stop:2535 length:1488 start_codon:yes stop_codon:yes gene_type:complete